MAKMTFSGGTLTSPAWAGECLGPETLIPGGAKIDPTGFPADAQGRKPIPAGTFIGRSYAERDAGTGFGPADVLTDDEVFLVAFDVVDALHIAEAELYQHGRVVKENFLPEWTTFTADEKAKVRELYQSIVGVN